MRSPFNLASKLRASGRIKPTDFGVDDGEVHGGEVLTFALGLAAKGEDEGNIRAKC